VLNPDSTRDLLTWSNVCQL